MEQILSMLPENIGGINVDHALACVAVAMTILAMIGWALDYALPRMRAAAAKTQGETDDKIVAWLDKAHDVLAMINSIIPRPTLGRGR